MADVLAVDEDVHVRPQLAALGEDAIAGAGTLTPQEGERFTGRGGRTLDPDFGAVRRELPQRTGDHEDVRHQTTAAFTEMTGGRPSTSSVQ